MCKLKRKRRLEPVKSVCVLAVALLFILATSAHAIRLNLSGSNLPDGISGPVQLMRQVGSYDPPGGGDDVEIRLVNIVQGRLAEPEIPIVVSGKNIPLVSGGVEKTPGALDDIEQETKLYLRIWDGDVGQGHYYAQSDVKTISWLETDPAVDWNITSWAPYLADVPQNVGVRVDREALERTGTAQELIIGIRAIHAGQTEILESLTVLEISKDPSFGDVADQTGGQKRFDSSSANASGSYFEPGVYYYIRSQKGNYYGSSPTQLLTSPIEDIPNPGDYVINAVGRYATLSGGIAAAFTFKLWGKNTDVPLVVNSIALPSLSLAVTTSRGVVEGDVSDAEQLGKLINDAVGKKVVSAICRWDPETGRAEAANFEENSDSLRGGQINFKLKEGEGYQVYTTETIDEVKFEGR
jgi:hypothetical protein